MRAIVLVIGCLSLVSSAPIDKTSHKLQDEEPAPEDAAPPEDVTPEEPAPEGDTNSTDESAPLEPHEDGQPGWYASEVQSNCNQACLSAGLECHVDDLNTKNENIDTLDKMNEVLASLGEDPCSDGMSEMTHYSTNLNVPLFAVSENGKTFCAVTEHADDIQRRYACDATAKGEGSRRLCYCNTASGERKP
jgi:hypothetical protein